LVEHTTHSDRSALVVRRSLASQIAQLIREDILLGRLKPGGRVSQQRLAHTYGTSRIPVRDAIRQLTQEGLLVSKPSGHVVVSRLTADDIIDAFAILATALGRAARRAARRATADDVAELRVTLGQMSAAAADPSAAFGELNWRLHRQINLLAGSEMLRATIAGISAGIPVAYPEFPLSTAEVLAAKSAIIDAIEAGHARTASDLMEEHVRSEGAAVVEYVREHELLESEPD
jgi:DNA-binding GntR family transcriptional regulator